MNATTARSFSLSADALRVLARHSGIEDLPAVLGLRNAHATVNAREASERRVLRALVDHGLVVDGAAEPETVPMLHALHRPDREFTLRLVTPSGSARASLVRRGRLTVLARRIGDDLVVRELDAVDLLDAAGQLLAELPAAAAADVEPVGAPLDRMSESLVGTHDPRLLADRIRALGATPRAALLLGAALGSRDGFAEIDYYALAPDEGRIRRVRASVAVLYTRRGRIVGAPSRSADGTVWSTFKPGSDRAVLAAIGQLAELSGERW